MVPRKVVTSDILFLFLSKSFNDYLDSVKDALAIELEIESLGIQGDLHVLLQTYLNNTTPFVDISEVSILGRS